MDQFTFNQLRYFYQLARTLNYREAAEQLFISQPALSKQMKVLETAMQVQLFAKAGRNIKLTQAGREFVVHVGRILRDLEMTNQAMAKFSQNSVSYLKVGVAESQLLAPLMNGFRERVPTARLQLFELPNQQILERIKDRRLDLGITFLPVAEAGLVTTPLFTDELVLVAAADNATVKALEQVDAAAIAQLPLVTLLEPLYLRRQVNRYFADHLVLPNYQYEVSNINSCIRIAENSDAAALVPRSAVRLTQPHHLQVRSLATHELTMRLGVVSLRETNLSPVIKRIQQTFNQQYR